MAFFRVARRTTSKPKSPLKLSACPLLCSQRTRTVSACGRNRSKYGTYATPFMDAGRRYQSAAARSKKRRPTAKIRHAEPTAKESLLERENGGLFDWSTSDHILDSSIPVKLTTEETAVVMYLESNLNAASEVSEGWRVFHKLKNPSIVAYGVMVRWLARRNLNAARGLLHKMAKRGPMPTVVTCTTVITAAARLGRADFAKAIYRFMMENKIEPNIITYNSLIYASSSCDRMDEAYQWLRMLEQSGIKPTDITFTTLLEAQIKTAKDKDKNWIPVAQAIVTAMRAQGLDPVPKLLVHVVRQLSWDRRCEEAMDIVDQIEATGKPAPKEMYEDIIEAYSHKGDQEGVLVALNRMRAYYSTNLSVFKSLDRVGCDINPQMLSSRLRQLCAWHRTDEARELVAVAERSGTPMSSQIHSLLISTYASAGLMQDAEERTRYMVEHGFKGSHRAWQSLVAGYAKRGSFQDVSRTMQDMWKWGLPLLTDGYNAIISGYFKLGQMKHAKDTFHAMLEAGMSPNSYTFNIMIDGVAHCGDMECAEAIWALIPKFGLKPELRALNSILHGYTLKRDEAGIKSALGRMRRFGGANDITYSILILDRRLANDLKGVESVMAKAKKLGIPNYILLGAYEAAKSSIRARSIKRQKPRAPVNAVHADPVEAGQAELNG